MDKSDRYIAEYVLLWDPYGWPPADQTFVEFGMTPRRLFERCEQLVRAARCDEELDSQEAGLVNRLAHILARRRPTELRSTQRRQTPATTVSHSVA